MVSAATEPHLFVIHGGSGDLAGRMLLPALRHLAQKDLLGESWRILTVGRRSAFTDETYRDWASEALERAGLGGDDLGKWCDSCIHYHALSDGGYRGLRTRIEAIEREAGLPGNRTFYLALPPQGFAPTIAGLGEAGLSKSPGWTRLVVEKPFGHDKASALELNETVHTHFEEDQVYRIDHYLGKETVQNLLVLRFGNTVFEDLWNRDRVSSVTITVAEALGVEDRGDFYEQTGALRDIVQNHLVQILALTAMEVPAAFDADSVRYEKVKVLRSIRPFDVKKVVFGQYAAGEIGGSHVPGYREEDEVAPDSETETFVGLMAAIDNWRWQGVPFYLRAGKRMPEKLTEIAVRFRRPPVCLFESMGSCLLHANELLIRLQPDEGFSFLIDVKAPGEPLALKRIPLSFRYGDEFGKLPDAYETLLLDVLIGDQTLFVHGDEVEKSWDLFDPLLTGRAPVKLYAAGTWGPAEADVLRNRNP